MARYKSGMTRKDKTNETFGNSSCILYNRDIHCSIGPPYGRHDMVTFGHYNSNFLGEVMRREIIRIVLKDVEGMGSFHWSIRFIISVVRATERGYQLAKG